MALGACALVTIAAAVVVAGGLPGAYTAGLGRGLVAVGATLLTLPTAIAAVFVSGFGVPFDWNVNALSEGHGSIGALGGTVPTSNAGLAHAHGAPGVLALAPILVLIAVFAVGWFSARRSQSNIKLCFANALRAAALLTLGVWLLGLIGRVDAQAGGLLGFHMAPDDSALIWRVPLISFVGCLGGSLAFLLKSWKRRAPSAATRTAARRAPVRLGRRRRWSDGRAPEPGLARRRRRRLRRDPSTRDRPRAGRRRASVGTGAGLGRADRTRSRRRGSKKTPSPVRKSKSPPVRKRA